VVGIKLPQGSQRTGEPSCGPMRILVVVADRFRLEELRALLLACGHSVEHTVDSLQAIRKLRMKEGLFDVATIVWDLPPVGVMALSCWDLERIWRALNPTHASVVIPKAHEEELNVLQLEQLCERASSMVLRATLRRKGGETRCGHYSS